MKKVDLIKNNLKLVNDIKLRLADRQMTNTDLIRELGLLGYTIYPSKLSYFLNQTHWYKGLSQTDIMVVCVYLGLFLDIKIIVKSINQENIEQQKKDCKDLINYYNTTK